MSESGRGVNPGNRPHLGASLDRRAGNPLAFSCIAQLVSVLGEHVFLLAVLPLWAYDRTGSSRGVGAALIAATAPALFSLPAGAWVARRSVRSSLTACAAIRFALTTLLFLPFLRSFSATLTVVFGIALVDSFFMPALKAALPDWAAPDELIRANSWMEATDIPPQLIGPPLGVFLYMRWGLAGGVAAQALAYGISLAILLRTPFPAREERKASSAPSFGRKLSDSLARAWRHRPLRRALLAWTAGMMTAGAAETLILPFLRESLGAPESAFGIVGGAIGAGMALGATLSALWEPPLSDASLLSLASLATTAALFAFIRSSGSLACEAAGAFAGAGLVWVHIATNALIQRETEEKTRSGVLGLTHSIEAAGLLIGMGAGGDLASRFGPRSALTGAVVLLFLASASYATATYRDEKKRA